MPFIEWLQEDGTFTKNAHRISPKIQGTLHAFWIERRSFSLEINTDPDHPDPFTAFLRNIGLPAKVDELVNKAEAEGVFSEEGYYNTITKSTHLAGTMALKHNEG